MHVQLNGQANDSGYRNSGRSEDDGQEGCIFGRGVSAVVNPGTKRSAAVMAGSAKTVPGMEEPAKKLCVFSPSSATRQESSTGLKEEFRKLVEDHECYKSEIIKLAAENVKLKAERDLLLVENGKLASRIKKNEPAHLSSNSKMKVLEFQNASLLRKVNENKNDGCSGGGNIDKKLESRLQRLANEKGVEFTEIYSAFKQTVADNNELYKQSLLLKANEIEKLHKELSQVQGENETLNKEKDVLCVLFKEDREVLHGDLSKIKHELVLKEQVLNLLYKIYRESLSSGSGAVEGVDFSVNLKKCQISALSEQTESSDLPKQLYDLLVSEDTARRQLQSLVQDKEGLLINNGELKAQVSAMDDEKKQLKEKNLSLIEKVMSLEKSSQSGRGQLELLQASSEKMEKALGASEEENKRKDREIDKITMNMKAISASERQTKIEFDRLTEKCSLDKEKMSSQCEQLVMEKGSLSKKNDLLSNELSASRYNIFFLESEKKRLEDEVRSLNWEIACRSRHKEVMEKQLQDIIQREGVARSELERAGAEVKVFSKKNDELEKQVSAMSDEKETLEWENLSLKAEVAKLKKESGSFSGRINLLKSNQVQNERQLKDRLEIITAEKSRQDVELHNLRCELKVKVDTIEKSDEERSILLKLVPLLQEQKACLEKRLDKKSKSGSVYNESVSLKNKKVRLNEGGEVLSGDGVCMQSHLQAMKRKLVAAEDLNAHSQDQLQALKKSEINFSKKSEALALANKQLSQENSVMKNQIETLKQALAERPNKQSFNDGQNTIPALGKTWDSELLPVHEHNDRVACVSPQHPQNDSLTEARRWEDIESLEGFYSDPNS